MKGSILVWLLLLALLPITPASSQCKTWQWPESEQDAQERYAIFQDAIQSKQYRKAANALPWLLNHTPNLNVAIYVKGVDAYEHVADAESDPAHKAMLVDTIMMLYDLRMTHCGEVGSVTNRKALTAFKYKVKGPDPWSVLEWMDKAFELNGSNVFDATLLPYMQTLVICQAKEKRYNEDQILKRYDIISKAIDDKMKTVTEKTQTEKLTKIQSEVDEWLLRIVKVDCEFVKTYMGPRLHESPEDLVLAKRVLAYLLKNKCTDDPLWVEAAEAVYKQEQDFGLAKNIAIQYSNSGNNEKAAFYMGEALRVAPDRKDSAEIYLIQGEWNEHLGSKPAAQSLLRKSIQLNSENKEAYEKLGDLYYGSFDDCAQHKVMADDRAVYCLAFDYYQKAGNHHKMEMAKKLFPSIEEIFLVNYQRGQKIQVGCYINESTTIKTRD